MQTTINDLIAAEDRITEVECILREFVAAGEVRCDTRREIGTTTYGTGLFDLDGTWYCPPARYAAKTAD